MLVLGDAGLGDVTVAEVHDGAALKIPVIVEALEVQRTIAKPSQAVAKESVQRAGPKDVVVIGSHTRLITRSQ